MILGNKTDVDVQEAYAPVHNIHNVSLSRSMGSSSSRSHNDSMKVEKRKLEREVSTEEAQEFAMLNGV